MTLQNLNVPQSPSRLPFGTKYIQFTFRPFTPPGRFWFTYLSTVRSYGSRDSKSDKMKKERVTKFL